MAGVGETGVWRTGVWVEPLDFEGDFALSAEAEIAFTGRFAYGGQFNLDALAETEFTGQPYFLGEFDLEANADTAFDGQFEAAPGQGIFGLVGNAAIRFAWVPDLGPPGGGGEIPGVPPSVDPDLKPGDVFVFNGVSGICALDSYGRLVVLNKAGEVMCIIGPSGVELP